MPATPVGEQRVLVVDLDEGDRRLVGVRVPVYGLTWVSRSRAYLLLQLDHPRLKVVEPLVVVRRCSRPTETFGRTKHRET